MKIFKTKVYKKILCLIFALLLSFNTFAAVVSDNDGSAFITKSEFDSLKNDFQAQIDQYNTSIDLKIDTAIAAYLAGIKTVVSEPSKVIVDNYNNIMWVGDFNVYGKWKKWTANSASNMTSNLTNSWFTPSLNEKRHSFRSNSGSLYSIWTQAWTMVTTAMEFVANSGANGVCQSVTTGWANSDFAGVPTLVLLMTKDSNGNYIANRLFNVYSMSPHAMSDDHSQSGTTGTEAYAWGNARWKATNLEILAKGANDILKFKVTATNLNNGASATYTDTLTPDNFVYPCTWCDDDHNANNDKFDTQTQVYNTSITTSNYFSTGCTWHKFDQRSVQNNFLKNMMLGRTNSQQVNAAYYIEYRAERGKYDFSKSTSYATWSGNIASLAVQTKYYTVPGDNITSGQIAVNKATSFSLPHWPTEYLRNLTSGQFKYDNQGLKFGEGFPLRIDNQTNGYLQVSFDSSVESILNGTKFSTQDLVIDMRKENFLSSSTNWAQGYKGLVNPDSTSEPLVILNGYKYTTTDGKINLTVPMKKDESLWIRIAPWDSTKGYCAKWSNLSMTMNAN